MNVPRYEYDREDGWIIENDGAGGARIVAKNVLPEFGEAIDIICKAPLTPHHLGYAVSGATGTYDTQSFLCDRKWYKSLIEQLVVEVWDDASRR